MSRFRCLVFLFSFTAVLVAAKPVAADPIQIVSGFVEVGGVQDVLSRGFLRSIGFDFATGLFQLSGSESDGPTQQVLFPRLPGVGESDLSSDAGINVFIAAGLFAVTAAPGPAPSPFELSGRLTILDLETRATLFDDIVFGRGTATWQFVPDPLGAGNVLSGARYEFSDAAATPEPATLLLLGTGAAATAARRRRRAGGNSFLSDAH